MKKKKGNLISRICPKIRKFTKFH